MCGILYNLKFLSKYIIRIREILNIGKKFEGRRFFFIGKKV